MFKPMFSTLEYAKRLEAAGIPREQAEAQAVAQGDLVVDPLLEQVVTKEDLWRLDHKLDALDNRLTVLDDRVTALDTRVTALDTRVTALDTRVTAVENRLTAVEDRLTAVGDRLTAVEDRLTVVERKVSDIDGKMSSLVTKSEFAAQMEGLVSKEYLEVRLDLLEKKITIRLGGLILLALAALSALNRFLGAA